MKLYTLILLLLLASCTDNHPPPPAPAPTTDAPLQTASPPQGSGIMEHIAGAAVAGAAAGSAGAVAHNMTNRAMGNLEKRRRAKRIARARGRRR